MKVLTHNTARPAMDGDGVNIRRVADFGKQRFDPFLMLDEIKSDDSQDFIGGFPPHPHRGIETFTYILKGGFEHRDHMGNVKAIRAGDVQWMSTGSGVIHSEMPLADAKEGLHGFQIWLNMPAKDKMRPAIYRDSGEVSNPKYQAEGVQLQALAGNWTVTHQGLTTRVDNKHMTGLAANGAIADLNLAPLTEVTVDLSAYGAVNIYLYSGALTVTENGQQKTYSQGSMLTVTPEDNVVFNAAEQGLGCLVLAGNPINEDIVHMGPFVMNTQEEIRQAVDDYQQGRFGELALV